MDETSFLLAAVCVGWVQAVCFNATTTTSGATLNTLLPVDGTTHELEFTVVCPYVVEETAVLTV
jgi:hypothetical protein